MYSFHSLKTMYPYAAPMLALAASEIVLAQDRAALRFKTDGSFKLSIFEDLHFGEAEDLDWGPKQDLYGQKVMNAVLDHEDQQLVVLNGDLITGENTYLHNSTDYVNEIVKPLIERNRVWASTYGNHDSDFNLSRSNILAREQTWPNSLTRQDVDTPTSGVSNYYLPVYSADKRKRCPELILWMFDSRGGHFYQQLDDEGNRVGQPSWVDQTVVDWFQVTKSKLRKQYGKDIPSLGFVHIPVSAMLAYQQSQGPQPHYEPGINDDVPLDQQKQDTPFMEALLDTPGMMALFSGHDHGNDWGFRWNSQLPGMNLTGNGLCLFFSRHSSYGGYGTWTRGSRQILVTEESLQTLSFETWNRLETGEISGRIMVDESYGHTYYPRVNDTHTSLDDSPLEPQ
ncbi:Hypothetical protein R9X50_00521900 [Acrodontium crateriforme]|uniref:Calcineurin-like phosphoesterase domain-containing protein n=1 Tax=Acrodontium crateriforme TaxID=150365 RepID=A0AAQ3RAQ1_9PEZI|nr:Hypothetical protein R9X50_00521900 [Acrodontium crateriforme]